MNIKINFLAVVIALQLSIVSSSAQTASTGTGCPAIFLEKLAAKSGQNGVLKSDAFLAPEVRSNFRRNIKTIFGAKNQKEVDQIEAMVANKIWTSVKTRPNDLIQNDIKTIEQGAAGKLDGVEYMFYVDQFGVAGKTADGTFDNVTQMLDHLEDLGVSRIYSLPFLKSPMKDGGFDVADFRTVSDHLGGNRAYVKFVQEARKRGMSVKMDLILNHVSEEHEWFQKFLKGDLRYKDYFVVREEPPKILGRYTDRRGQMVKYLEKGPDGKEIEIERRLIFPDIADSHYRKVEVSFPDGKKKDYWVYHTFFPFQLDLNYSNPEVLKEALDVVSYWANQGVDLFRLDAIPFLDKTAENHPRTHAIVELMSSYLKQIAPSSNFMVEANQKPVEMVAYLGKSQKVKNRFLEKTISGTSEASMAYNFGEIPFWASLLDGDKKHILKAHQDLSKIRVPQETAWATFLRVHDELTLEMVDPEVRNIINERLLAKGKEKGLPFREGFGVAGRLAPFLGNDPERIRVAYSILMGRPGQPVIFYGDEIAAGNNIEYMVSEGLKRKEFMDKNKIAYKTPGDSAKAYFESRGIPVNAPLDARDANRGPISKAEFFSVREPSNKDAVGARVYKDLKQMIAARNNHPAVRRGKQTMLESDQAGVLSYMMSSPEEKLLILNNLKKDKLKTAIQLPKNASIPPNGKLTDAITGKAVPYTKEGNRFVLDVSGYDALWLVLPN